MLIYFILYGLLILGAAVCFETEALPNKQQAKKVFCVIGFISIALFMSLRHPSSGLDIISRGEKIGYYDMFTYISKIPLKKCFTMHLANYENGYIVLNKLLSFISKSPQILIAFCGILQSACVFTLIYKTSKKPFLSTIIYLALPCFLINLSGLRQSIAISLTLVAFLMIKEKKPIKFILLVLLAYTMHKSSLIFIIAYPIYYVKQSAIWKFFSVVSIPTVYIFREPLFKVLSKIFKDDATTQDTGAFTLFFVFTLMYIFLIVFTNKKSSLANGCANLFYVACLCQAFGGLYDTVLRVTYYFMISAIIGIPEILSKDSGDGVTLDYKYRTFFSVILSIIFIGYALYIFNDGVGNYPVQWFKTNPYVFFWQNP